MGGINVENYNLDLGEAVALSASAYLTAEVALPYCNESDDLTHRVFGTLSLAGLALLSLVEGVARIAFTALMLAGVLLTLGQVEVINTLAVVPGLIGTIGSFENFIISSVAAFQVFGNDDVYYEEVLPCLTECSTDLFRGIVNEEAVEG